MVQSTMQCAIALAALILTTASGSTGCTSTEGRLAREVALACRSFATDLTLASEQLQQGKVPWSAYGDFSMEARHRSAGLAPMFYFCLRTHRIAPERAKELSIRFDVLTGSFREAHSHQLAAQHLLELGQIAREAAELPLVD